MYEFRSEATRGIRVSFPSPEPVITPRAREGLRAVVPMIFPPGTVNRGESVRLRPEESARNHRAAIPAKPAPDGLLSTPKKRGPKPKIRFKDNLYSEAEHSKRRSEEHMTYLPVKMRKLTPLESEKTVPLRVIKLHQRHQEDAGYSQVQMRAVPSGSSQQRLGPERSSHAHRASLETHSCRTTKCPDAMMPSVHPRLKRLASQQSSLIAKIPVTRIFGQADEDSWSPCLENMEKVVVTDVTTNFLTVTIKESSTDQGFFRDKRWLYNLTWLAS